jgi:hypothetical protein
VPLATCLRRIDPEGALAHVLPLKLDGLGLGPQTSVCEQRNQRGAALIEICPDALDSFRDDEIRLTNTPLRGLADNRHRIACDQPFDLRSLQD